MPNCFLDCAYQSPGIRSLVLKHLLIFTERKDATICRVIDRVSIKDHMHWLNSTAHLVSASCPSLKLLVIHAVAHLHLLLAASEKIGLECLTLPLSGRQGSRGGAAENSWWPVYSRGLLGTKHMARGREGSGLHIT
jgi:hypothetical protein